MAYKIKKVGEKYMIVDTDIGQFLIGYTFNTDVEAYKFINIIEGKI